ncbi:hypothetical protein NDU88_002481 [Pleurodeles waltl]|uniref:Uncharacterized protein n=1 Tax=Pleurodeles waltl TaxID=8319 RepID=A0AAV7UAY4_PLEWA|nr:hypothetical protein NDU88_002481 [Pleurodeles waltl]
MVGLAQCPSWLSDKVGSKSEIVSNEKRKYERELKKAYERKITFDRRKAVKKLVIRVGDLVRVRNPRLRLSRDHSKFSAPLKVIKVLGNAVRTEDLKYGTLGEW